MDAVDPGGMQKWIGKKIKDFYREKGYTRETFAAALGYSDPKIISNACSGTNISAMLAIRLARAMGKPPEYFLCDEPCPLRDLEYEASHGGGRTKRELAALENLKYQYDMIGEDMYMGLDVKVFQDFVSDVSRQAVLYRFKQIALDNDENMEKENKMNIADAGNY